MRQIRACIKYIGKFAKSPIVNAPLQPAGAQAGKDQMPLKRIANTWQHLLIGWVAGFFAKRQSDVSPA